MSCNFSLKYDPVPSLRQTLFVASPSIIDFRMYRVVSRIVPVF